MNTYPSYIPHFCTAHNTPCLLPTILYENWLFTIYMGKPVGLLFGEVV